MTYKEGRECDYALERLLEDNCNKALADFGTSLSQLSTARAGSEKIIARIKEAEKAGGL
jgi:hypothetical protein